MKIYLILSSLFIALMFSACRPTQVVVHERPVAPVYVRPAPPRSSYIWVEGEWVWTRGGYVYRQGYWAAPRHRSNHYKPGYWRHTRGGWVWVPGRY